MTETTVSITLRVENFYVDDGSEVVTTPTATVPAPTAEDWEDELESWGYEHVHDLTGTGRMDGEATYDVTVTASSEPRLVGLTFGYGY